MAVQSALTVEWQGLQLVDKYFMTERPIYNRPFTSGSFTIWVFFLS